MGVYTILMKICTLVNRAISVPGPRRQGKAPGQGSMGWGWGKGLDRYRQGHNKIRIGPSQARIRT